MLSGGDFNLNSVQIYADSLKVVLKQTILNQEVIFRKQVHELHRLYSIQKTLMEGIGCADSDRCKLWKASAQPFSLAAPSPTNNMLPGREKTWSAIPMLHVGSTQSISQEFSEVRGAIGNKIPALPLMLNQRHLDLQLPADQYISHVDEDISPKGGVWDPSKQFRLGNVSDTEVNTSLVVREKTGGIYDEKNYYLSHDVIDLEEAIEHISDEQNFFSRGLKDLPDDTNNLFSQKLQDNSFERELMDLNRVQLDDSSCYSNDLVAAYPSTASSSCPIMNCSEKSSDNCSNETFNDKDNNSTVCAVSCELKEICESPKSVRNQAVALLTQVSFEKSEESNTLSNFNAETSSSSVKIIQSGSKKGNINTLVLNEKNKEPADIDSLIQTAAESLIQISLDISSSYDNKMESKETERPECTSDSYELIVLNLKETSADEFCVSSKPYEISEMETRDFGFKLKRGRRMKDFQKEILPNLASLSRHEICEDINIMEAVLRSREYKRLRSKMTDRDNNWFTPVRSRRSRRNCVGRRNFYEKFVVS